MLLDLLAGLENIIQEAAGIEEKGALNQYLSKNKKHNHSHYKREFFDEDNFDVDTEELFNDYEYEHNCEDIDEFREFRIEKEPVKITEINVVDKKERKNQKYKVSKKDIIINDAILHRRKKSERRL